MTTSKTITAWVDSDAGQLEIEAAELRVSAGPDRGLEVSLGADSLRIGTAADCEIVLHDETVSAYHAEIQATRRGYRIRDLRSKNGLRLGKWPVLSAPLAHGMRIQLGGTTFTVRTLGRRHQIPLRQPGALGMLVAHSVKMRSVAATVEQLAAAEITVLLEGESGTGKEVAARVIHQLSARQQGPLVVVDCGAIPATLFGGELFGHQPGAFTGATDGRPGLLEEADGGTLFLDEIGEVPLELQPLLLGAIERKAARRVGGGKEVTYDVRFIAATNRNLAEEVRAGRFREDLYYRLAVGQVRLPPLRERPEDLEVLARTFAAEEGLAITTELLRLLRAYEWPGNVRELRNTIARAAIAPTSLPLPSAGQPTAQGRFRHGSVLVPLSEARRQAQGEFERAYVLEALELAQGNMSQAAKLAGVSRPFFMRLAQRHQLLARDRR